MKWLTFIVIASVLTVIPSLGRVIGKDEPKPSIFNLPVENAQPEKSNFIHTISVTVTSLDDLKVTEGESVKKNQILCDRTSERQRLEAKKKQLEMSWQQMSLPLTQISSLPSPNLDAEEVALKKARFELDGATRALGENPELPFKEQWLNEVFKPEKVKEISRLKERQLKTSIEVEAALARLSEARTRYQQQQYQHSIQLAAQEANLQKQQYDLSSLTLQLQEVQQQLNEVSQVRSPYKAIVRRLKVTGQTDTRITAEITLDVEEK